MKTRSFVTLGAACLLALTACSGGGDTNAQNTASASSPTSKQLCEPQRIGNPERETCYA